MSSEVTGNGQVMSVQPVKDAGESIGNEGSREDKQSLLTDNLVENSETSHQRISRAKTTINVFTINVWGLKFVAKNRLERFKAISEFVNSSDYDVVFMQELWLDTDYLEMKQRIKVKFPYAHNFDSGIIGSGTCIFSRCPLQEANFHEFSINGYPTNFWHGDWFAAKGIGVCQIDYEGFDIHLYVSHYHANYKPSHDIYLSHRVSHAFESALWIKLASSAADLTIYAGDFNTESTSLPYKLLRAIAPLHDCWSETHTANDPGETSECGYNSYTVPCAGNGNGKGHRIDYVMHCAGPNIVARATKCSLPMARRVPGKNFSYSDHEGVEATIEMTRTHDMVADNTAVAYRRGNSLHDQPRRCEVIKEAMEVMDRALVATGYYKARYLVITIVLVILLCLMFIPTFFLRDSSGWVFVIVDLSLFLPRFIVTIALVIFFLMGTLFTKRERNAQVTCKKHLKLLLDASSDKRKNS